MSILKSKRSRPLLKLDDFTKDHEDPRIASKALNHFFDDMKKKMTEGEKEVKLPYFGRFRLKDRDGKIIK
jgi:nucleoid DNA-binding protein